jgi:hypothetical protein
VLEVGLDRVEVRMGRGRDRYGDESQEVVSI